MRRLLAAIMLAATPVAAQTVQPTYTRPSKGQSISLVSQAIWGPSGAITPPTSSVFDWSAFSGIGFSFTRANTVNTCISTLRVRVLGSNTTSGPFDTILDAPASEYDARESGASWYVPVTAPYIKVSFYVYPFPGIPSGVACTDVVQLKATPIPFDYAAKPSVVVGTSANHGLTATFSPLTNYLGTSASGNGGKRSLRLQNVGTTPVACAIGGGGTPSIYLSAGSLAEDGKGGVAQMETWTGFIQCKCIGGGCTGSMTTTAW